MNPLVESPPKKRAKKQPQTSAFLYAVERSGHTVNDLQTLFLQVAEAARGIFTPSSLPTEVPPSALPSLLTAPSTDTEIKPLTQKTVNEIQQKLRIMNINQALFDGKIMTWARRPKGSAVVNIADFMIARQGLGELQALDVSARQMATYLLRVLFLNVFSFAKAQMERVSNAPLSSLSSISQAIERLTGHDVIPRFWLDWAVIWQKYTTWQRLVRAFGAIQRPLSLPDSFLMAPPSPPSTHPTPALPQRPPPRALDSSDVFGALAQPQRPPPRALDSSDVFGALAQPQRPPPPRVLDSSDVFGALAQPQLPPPPRALDSSDVFGALAMSPPPPPANDVEEVLRLSPSDFNHVYNDDTLFDDTFTDTIDTERIIASMSAVCNILDDDDYSSSRQLTLAHEPRLSWKQLAILSMHGYSL
jgi:hypothetical protein